jgi:acyl-CoA synthetase (AMP-forming)/AMP-acid ligase II
MRDRAAEVAAALHERGVGPGDRVLLQMSNSWQMVACLFGINRLGAIAVPTNPFATIDDFIYVADHSACKVALVDAARTDSVIDGLDMIPAMTALLTVGGEPIAGDSLERAIEHASSEAPVATRRDDDLAAVFYTSGTTGWPKGVVLTNANIAFGGAVAATVLDVQPSDRWLVTLPLFHYNAFGISLMSALHTGGSVVLADPERSTWQETAAAHRATLGSLFARHLRDVLSHPVRDGDHRSPVRLVLFAQNVTQAEREEFERRFTCSLVQFYGMTETVGIALIESADEERATISVGSPLPWWEMDFRPSPHQTGDGRRADVELWIRGRSGVSLFAGYLASDEPHLVDGWFRTGDLFSVNEFGTYEFLGRVDDVMKPDVDNVSAAEVERVLTEHPSVDDVVVGASSSRPGEQSIHAWVALRAGEDVTVSELDTWSRERLAPHKVPGRIAIVDAIPRTAVGKVLWRKLRTEPE